MRRKESDTCRGVTMQIDGRCSARTQIGRWNKRQKLQLPVPMYQQLPYPYGSPTRWMTFAHVRERYAPLLVGPSSFRHGSRHSQPMPRS